MASVMVPPVSLTPDRRRIDSDVRAFLRQPSTPWITFDKDGRPSRHSVTAVGEVFTSARTSILGPDMFPAPPSVVLEPAVEPSSLVVASDIAAPEPIPTVNVRGTTSADLLALTRPSGWKRAAAVAAGFAGVVAVAALVFGLSGTSSSDGSTKSAASQSMPNARSGSDLPPPDFGAASALEATTPKAAPTADDPAKAAAKKFARLTIAGNAQKGFVFLDGKRLLGKGARSFTVTCGVHQIAVGDRAVVHDVDLPCNAEYVVDGASR